MTDVEETIVLFQSLGLSEQKAKETLKNTQVTNSLKLAVAEVSLYLYIPVSVLI